MKIIPQANNAVIIETATGVKFEFTDQHANKGLHVRVVGGWIAIGKLNLKTIEFDDFATELSITLSLKEMGDE